MICAMCKKEFYCTRKSPLCSTEESRGFKRATIQNKDEYINGVWSERLRNHLKEVDYCKLVPDNNFKHCICYHCLNGPVGKGTTFLFIEGNTELLHFYFGTTKGINNQMFPKDVPIILICYGADAVALESL